MKPYDPALIAALRDQVAALRYYVELFFDGGTERLWTGIGTTTELGVNWQGVGSLASIEGLEEGIELTPTGLKLGLSRLDPGTANLAINEDYYGRLARLYVGVENASGQLVSDPGPTFTGKMVHVEATVGTPDGEIIQLTVQSALAKLDRSPNLRHTDIQQQTDYTDDVGAQYMTQVADFRPVWRGKNQTRLGGSPGGGGGEDLRDLR